MDVAWHHDRPTHEQNRKNVHPGPPDPEEGGEGYRHVVAAEVGAGEQIDNVPGDIAVGEHHPLRPARSARGVRKQTQVVQPDRLLDGAARRPGYQRLEVRRPVQRTPNRDSAKARAAHRRGTRREVLDEDPWLDVLENPGNLSLVQPMIHRGQGRAEQAGCEQRFEKRGVVRPQPRHPVALCHAQRPQAVGKPAAAVSQSRVRQRTIPCDQRHTFGGRPGPALDPRADADVSHSGARTHTEYQHAARYPGKAAVLGRPADVPACRPGLAAEGMAVAPACVRVVSRRLHTARQCWRGCARGR